ncbi:MAG: D-alanyl-D-alanine carboxypeptidase [Clostridiales bacterium]|nr:D-alanyl-D-alanine carboxypeptidase [Clostridiales bacterium]MDY5514924.1 D-alanyl-D-alanine carboxypeptidase family protein [Candidatus Ventricola sp.]
MKKIAVVCALGLLLLVPRAVFASEEPMEAGVPITLTSPSAILTEASTGRVIFEKNADERRPVASVTKVMTILLTLEALDEGSVTEKDSVLVSEHAAGMGGSQAFLDANRSYPLGELLGSVIIASANDSAVALAEYLCGAEEAFVRRMNERAAQLGLANTHYVNCTGLPASDHYTTARDIARLSAQLDAHPRYYQYSTVWMKDFQHSGGRITQLTNTNRLIRFYPGCDGYKTGSTNEARYCISATAKKNGMRMIAVVLGSDASQTRFDEARSMLEYGFASVQLFTPISEGDSLDMTVPVRLGGRDGVSVVSGGTGTLLLRRGEQSGISLEAALLERVTAPVHRGDVLGEIRVRRGDEILMTIPAVAGEDVALPGMLSSLLRIRDGFMFPVGR